MMRKEGASEVEDKLADKLTARIISVLSASGIGRINAKLMQARPIRLTICPASFTLFA